MVKRAHSLDDYVEKSIETLNAAAEEKNLVEVKKLTHLFEALSKRDSWLKQCFDADSAQHFLNRLEAVLFSQLALKNYLDRKKNSSIHYIDRIGAIGNTLSSLSSVIEKLELACENNTVETRMALKNSLIQLEANQDKVEVLLEKSASKSFLGAITMIGGLVATFAALIHLNFILLCVGLLSVGIGATLLSPSKKEKKAEEARSNLDRLTGSVMRLFKSIPTNGALQSTVQPLKETTDHLYPSTRLRN